MIVGNTGQLAIESGITHAYDGPGFPALGYFCLHIGGQRCGVFDPEATMLGNSLDEVERRFLNRGSHVTPFASESDGRAIADSVYRAIYAWDQEDKQFFGIGHADFKAMIHGTRIMWAPDGDEAFDDGAYVLQFDVGDRVRLIAFKAEKTIIPFQSPLWISG